MNALREDMRLSHETVARRIAVLERLYAIVRIGPFGGPRIRAVHEAQKHSHFDWTVVSDQARRFENLVAMHLLKWVPFQQDSKGVDLELRCFRDVDLRELDFVVTESSRPTMLVEVEWADGPVEKGMRYLKERSPAADARQISAAGTKDHRTPQGLRVCPARILLAGLV